MLINVMVIKKNAPGKNLNFQEYQRITPHIQVFYLSHWLVTEIKKKDSTMYKFVTIQQ